MTTNVYTWLREAAAAVPGKIAFSDGKTAVTYGELLRRSQAGATAVSRALGGRRRLPVFVCIGRRADDVLAFLSVAAAGCFYVPVDLSLPRSRLEELYRQMEPPLVIIPDPCADVSAFPSPGVSLADLCAGEADPALLDRIAGEMLDYDPLYCIFTSGSTGVPKGVLVSHRSVINMAEQFTRVFGLDERCVFGNQAPFDFDVSVKDIYCALRNRATVHILERSLFSQPKKLIGRMNEHGVNTAIWSVSAMKILSAFKAFRNERPEKLRLMMFSGEVLPCRLLAEWQDVFPEAEFVNLYGPTEITCNCTYYKVRRRFDPQEVLPIGVPFPNIRVFLLDGDRPVTQPGEVGEICVSGTCLALGYFGEPELTAAAFPQNPAQSLWPERIYRTGDLGRLNQDGELLFLGRADSQVKYMGFRVELGEIEAKACAVDFVEAACCLFDGEKDQLCLFYQARERNDRALTLALKQSLPAHMVPRRLICFDQMPLNRTGKPDRGLLKREYLGRSNGTGREKE